MLALAAASLALAGPASPGLGDGRPSVTVTPVQAWQPGDLVWSAEPPAGGGPAAPASRGCERVPATGYIGSDVYARTAGHYSNSWQWSAGSASQPFHWWVFTTGGTLKATGASGGEGGSTTISANNHYWKVRNDGSAPQAWNVCWSG